MPAPFFAQAPVLLGEEVFTTAKTTSVQWNFDPYPMMYLSFCVEGYSGSAIVSLRVGSGTTLDATAGNYASNWWPMTGTTAPTAPTNTLGTFAGIKLGQNAVNNQRGGFLQIKNNLTTMHMCEGMSQTAGAATSSAVVYSSGGGRYVPTTANRITCAQIVVDVAGVTLSAGSSFSLYGLGRPG